MLFKFFLFFPLTLFALPGYHTPWGKDSDLKVPTQTKGQEIKDSTATKIAKKIIVFHQKVISPIDGPRSHFYPCSSQYMKLAMTKHGFLQGFIMGCDRLLRENKADWVYKNVIIDQKLIKYDPPK
jgi:putative component of membrane protein insertase Oxa1/YidC/SpoIIIJ protein YidD